VRPVANLAGMRRVLAETHVYLIVLDLMLPDGDGVDACRRLRGEGNATPVLMLTARGDEIDRIVGLEIGADDYLPKPCAPRELLARVRAILRRAQPAPGAAPRDDARPLHFGEFEFDARTRQLRRNGEALRLTSGEFAVLAALAAQPGKPMSRDQLMNLARGADHEAFDRSIDVMVSRVRKLIEPEPRQPRYLQTVWGVGYVFVADGQRA
jgi:DNA-binding response OmpR family regulator